MKKKLILGLIIAAALLLWACRAYKDADGTGDETVDSELIVVGFSQLGAESDWRSANTDSMRNTFTAENGYRLLFDDGQQKQSNQIMAIRTFIQQEVDYILLAPVTETGWDTVLQEAKDANIPVIIVDRQVDVADESLYTAWVGSDFELEGRKVCEWLHSYLQAKSISDSDINIVSLQGNLGASAQIGRTKGLEETAKKYGWNLLAEVPADFTQTKGREVMKQFLIDYPELNVVYCENDNEALGAIEAIEEAGRVCGPNIADGEIMLLSFDGVNREAINNVLTDKILCIAECNPLHGPRVDALIRQLENGNKPDKHSYVDENIFSHDRTIFSITVDGVSYPVTQLNGEQ